MIGYSDPALEGTNVTFHCSSPGASLLLDGPDSTMCRSNGQWEPDPRKVRCIGGDYYSLNFCIPFLKFTIIMQGRIKYNNIII